MAKPWWANFSIRLGNPILERLSDSLAENGFGAPNAGRRLYQAFANIAPATADSPIRGDMFQLSTVSPAPSAAGLILDTPAGAQGGIESAPAPATVGAPVDNVVGGDAERSGTTLFGGGGGQFAASPNTMFAEEESNFVVLYSDDFQSGLVMNTLNRTLLTGGPGDWPELGKGANDTLQLSGDFSAGFQLPAQPGDLDVVVLGADNDYNLVAADAQLGSGETLTINAGPLGNGGQVIFDGSAESDGNFLFIGGALADTFLGGAGDDRIMGNGGADMLSGGGGSDTFVYGDAGESSSTGYDTLAGFTAGTDHIDLPGTVSGFAAPIASGSLSTASFDADLGTALAGLGAAQAAWFAPDAGDLAGTVFLIVDANGIAGYQPGQDYVFAIGGSPLADLTGHSDIFV
ncbi:MAG TPA: calcium-binding protein [Allosphingosinicella sp.]|nr:calcium-binding protein [Allosphingosinicella sp.]